MDMQQTAGTDPLSDPLGRDHRSGGIPAVTDFACHPGRNTQVEKFSAEQMTDPCRPTLAPQKGVEDDMSVSFKHLTSSSTRRHMAVWGTTVHNLDEIVLE